MFKVRQATLSYVGSLAREFSLKNQAETDERLWQLRAALAGVGRQRVGRRRLNCRTARC